MVDFDNVCINQAFLGKLQLLKWWLSFGRQVLSEFGHVIYTILYSVNILKKISSNTYAFVTLNH